MIEMNEEKYDAYCEMLFLLEALGIDIFTNMIGIDIIPQSYSQDLTFRVKYIDPKL
jgi:hypothetical protein